MRTTYSGHFEKSFMHGLAQVGKRKTRKQLLKSILSEALSSVDMARGLQGRGDWLGAVEKLSQAAGIIDQAIDLAETLPGVNFVRTRSQATQVSSRLSSVSRTVDTEPMHSRAIVKDCEQALVKAITALGMFAEALNDGITEKDQLEFSENDLIKQLNGQIQKQEKVDPLIRAAGKKGFSETKEELEGKPEVKDPEKLAGWLKAKARERGQLAEEHKEKSGEETTDDTAAENVIEPAGKIEKPGCV